MEEEKSKILIIGATGHLGRFIANASIAQFHPTYALVRPATISAEAELVHSFKALGIIILEGSLEDHGSLVEAIKQVDVVISAVKGPELLNQINIIAAIKEVGKIKRFLPSEFGLDVDHVKALERVQSMFNQKIQIRRATEEAQIPYTYISSFCFAEYFLKNLAQPGGLTSPPRDKVIIYGDGNTKVSFLSEEDIGTYTIKAVDDPRTLNKTVHLRLPTNILCQNEVVALWERKIGKTLEKIFMSEEELVQLAEATPFTRDSISAAIKHAIFVKGYMCNFDIGPCDVEASKLYTKDKYTTVAEYLQNIV